MDNADTELERGDEPICDTFRGTSADERIRRKLIYTSMKQAPMSNTDSHCRAGLRVFSFSV